MKKMNFSKRAAIGAFLVVGVGTAVGCSKGGYDTSGSTSSGSLATTNVSQAQVKVAVQVLDSANNPIYTDSNSASSLVLKAGQTYQLVLSPSYNPNGASYSLQLTQIDAVNTTPQSITVQPGANSFSVPVQGDYSLKLIATAPSMLQMTKYYNANVTCANPTFTAASLDASKISASAGSGSNLYNFSAAGIAANSNGQAPYTCAFDQTGSGIIDSAFQDCNTALSNSYVNYVSNRNVSVIVKDACNSTFTVTKTLNLPYSVPAIGNGNVFIYGAVSGASGLATGDKRVDEVTYLATNSGGHNIVQPNYSSGNFNIEASMNYNMASSVGFGMSIAVQGITGTLDIKNGTGSLNASAATIKSVTYSTDQAGDTAGAMAFSGSNCTLTNQNVKVVFTAGTPCASNQTGTGKQATVEVYGDYSCTGLSTSGAAMNVSGSFDGLTTIVDSCSGGGGGGGGIVPINL